MPQCPKCKRVWKTLPGEEQDHDCPHCGDVFGRNKSPEDNSRDEQLDEAGGMGGGRDLTQQENNPSRWIQDHYQEIVHMQDPQELLRFVLNGVQPMVSHGFGRNYKKFEITLKRLAAEQDALGMHRYLTNFMLAGTGLGVSEGIQTGIASMISEDVNEVRLTRQQLLLKILVESNTKFRVVLLSNEYPVS